MTMVGALTLLPAGVIHLAQHRQHLLRHSQGEVWSTQLLVGDNSTPTTRISVPRGYSSDRVAREKLRLLAGWMGHPQVQVESPR